MIRLRQSLEDALRHPLLGPVLLVFMALMLAFICLHTIEHGAVGLLFPCVLLVAAGVRLVVVSGRVCRASQVHGSRPSRGPPARVVRANRPPPAVPALVVLPLRL